MEVEQEDQEMHLLLIRHKAQMVDKHQVIKVDLEEVAVELLKQDLMVQEIHHNQLWVMVELVQRLQLMELQLQEVVVEDQVVEVVFLLEE